MILPKEANSILEVLGVFHLEHLNPIRAIMKMKMALEFLVLRFGFCVILKRCAY